MDTKSLVNQIEIAWLIGMVYFTLEGLWRGWTNITMLFIGGICGAAIGLLNQHSDLRIWQQTIMGTVIALIIELISGLVFNRLLGLDLWDYSDQWGNIYGQICPVYAALWLLICLFAIWVDDFIRWRFYNEGRYYPPWENYVELIKLK